MDEVFDIIKNENSFITSFNNRNIELLYFNLKRYVKSNYLDFDEIYILKKDGIFYECGVLYGPEIIYYLKSLNENTIVKYIDYNNLKNNTLSEEDNNNKIIFDQINESINYLKEKGLSLKLINRSIKL